MYRFQWPSDPNHYYILHIYLYSRKNTRKPMFRMYILVQTYVTVYTYLFSPVKKYVYLYYQVAPIDIYIKRAYVNGY